MDETRWKSFLRETLQGLQKLEKKIFCEGLGFRKVRGAVSFHFHLVSSKPDGIGLSYDAKTAIVNDLAFPGGSWYTANRALA